MIKPEYLFIWILLHLSAVEFPRKLKKQSTVPVPAAEHVVHARYKKAVKMYSKVSDIKVADELKAHAFALGKLHQYDSSLTEYKLWMNKYSSNVTAPDLLNVVDVALSAGQKVFADSLIMALKVADYSYGAIYSEFNDPAFLTTQVEPVSTIEVSALPIADSVDAHGLVFGPNKVYYHARLHRTGGLRSSISPVDDKPFPSIMVMDSLDETKPLAGKFLEELPPSRYREISYADPNGDLYFTYSARWVSNTDQFNLEVFRSYYDPRVSKVVEKNIGINSVDYSVSDVAFSPSGNSAVFCSNMEGGSGKADIFLAEVFRDKKSGKLTLVNPVNLGAKVNTMLSETNPMFITEQIIAFASNGHIGFGGKDIYFYNLLNTEIRNAGPAINSPFDEFCPARKGDRFYFSSNRQGKFKNRFYACALPDSLLENWIVPPYVPEVVPEEPVVPETPAIVVNNDAVIVDVLQNIQNSSTQKYQYAQALSFLLLTDSARQEKIKQADSATDYKEYRFLTIYHPQNDLRIETGFEKELDLLADLLNKRKDWGVEVRSHTDSRGSMQLNASLSQRRAKYITDYLIAKGVNPAQVRPIGFGESLPVNHCSDGVECTEEEYRQNRRTEFVLTPKIFWTKGRGKAKPSVAPATRTTVPPKKTTTPPARAAVPAASPNSASSSGTRNTGR